MLKRIEHSQLILCGHYNLDIKDRPGHYKKTKLQINMLYEYRCKNPQQYTRKPNAAAY